MPLGDARGDDIWLILHELATDAAKYGALSVEEGEIYASRGRGWTIVLMLKWEESGGPSLSGPPKSEGFGTVISITVSVSSSAARSSTPGNLQGLRWNSLFRSND